MTARRRNSVKNRQKGLRSKASVPYSSRRTTIGKTYTPLFRGMSLDDMLDLSSELTQYCRGLLAYSDCSKLAQLYMNPDSPHKAEVALAELNKQIVEQNRLKYAPGYTMRNQAGRTVNRCPRTRKVLKKPVVYGMTPKQKADE